MTEGKLVRDLIPDRIRETGRRAEVRYLAGDALVAALGAKLIEEAHEAAEAVGDRDRLLEELADVREVVAALMDVRGITDEDLTRAAMAKVKQCGAFHSGAWLLSPVPAKIREYTAADMEAQRVKWIPGRWKNAFAGHEAAYKALIEHSKEAGGIARSFVHAQASGDPVDLFLMAMAWGYRPKDYGTARTEQILQQDRAEEKIAAIVHATRHDGIKGLNMAFGTKLLYFAGYFAEHRPRPLVLDQRVRNSLQTLAPGTVPRKGKVWTADYLRYLNLAEDWAAEPTWAQEPDVVEYALFNQ